MQNPATAQGAPPSAAAAPWWRESFLRLWPALAIVIVDQISKFLVEHLIEPGHSIHLLGDFLILTHQLNPAGAMSIRLGPPVFYLIVTAFVAGFLVFTLMRRTVTPPTRVALLLVLGGAVGNMIDRIRIGAVIDFVDVEFFDFSLPAIHWGPIQVPGDVMTRWPVFNVADACVTCGIVLLILAALFLDRRYAQSQSQGV